MCFGSFQLRLNILSGKLQRGRSVKGRRKTCPSLMQSAVGVRCLLFLFFWGRLLIRDRLCWLGFCCSLVCSLRLPGVKVFARFSGVQCFVGCTNWTFFPVFFWNEAVWLQVRLQPFITLQHCIAPHYSAVEAWFRTAFFSSSSIFFISSYIYVAFSPPTTSVLLSSSSSLRFLLFLSCFS